MNFLKINPLQKNQKKSRPNKWTAIGV